MHKAEAVDGMHKAEEADFEGESGGGGGVYLLGEAVGQAAEARFEAVAEVLNQEGAGRRVLLR